MPPLRPARQPMVLLVQRLIGLVIDRHVDRAVIIVVGATRVGLLESEPGRSPVPIRKVRAEPTA
ncbi:hypothetical protein [Kibdelosporangium philippinense]|uniref:hypothetical protein n=1 Tax=Kibdelosporangium philippinense TaxID=211113 RepID=UPI0036217706